MGNRSNRLPPPPPPPPPRFAPAPYDFPNDICRILMLGKSGTGKSSTGNTLLGREKFKIACTFTGETEQCHRESAKFYNTTLEVIDTPGLFDPSHQKQWAEDIIAKGLASLEPGPNIILFTISCKTRFTDEDKKAFDIIRELMGPRVSEYMIVVFTAAEELDTTIGQCLAVKSKSDPEEKSMVAEVAKYAGARHVTFNNKLPLNSEERDMQVDKFLETALKMVSVNSPEHFCNTMSEKVTEIVTKYVTEECAKTDKSDKEVRDKMKQDVLRDDRPHHVIQNNNSYRDFSKRADHHLAPDMCQRKSIPTQASPARCGDDGVSKQYTTYTHLYPDHFVCKRFSTAESWQN